MHARTLLSFLLVSTLFLSPAHGAPANGDKGAGGQPAPAIQPPARTDADDADGEDGEKSLQQQLDDLKNEVRKMRKEAEVRKKLEVTEDEKAKKGEEILSTIGREYTLLKKGRVGLEYSFTYAYFSDDIIQSASGVLNVEQRGNHNLTNTVYAEYGLLDNFSVNMSVPFVYKYNRVGTADATDVNDLGDVSFGMQYQPFKAGGDLPTAIFNLGISVPLGRSPYETIPDQDLPTGSGFYSPSAGVSLSKTLDPLIAFGSLSYTYNLPAEGLDQKWKDGRTLVEVDPGSSIGGALGLAYALSYKATLNLTYQYSFNFGNEYFFANAPSAKTGATVGSQLSIGTGWRIVPSRSVTLKVGIGLTNNDPDFTFSVRVPFEF